MYTVECEHEGVKLEFPGLSALRAMDRAECERGKALWTLVRVVDNATGRTVAAYHGGAPCREAMEVSGR